MNRIISQELYKNVLSDLAHCKHGESDFLEEFRNAPTQKQAGATDYLAEMNRIWKEETEEDEWKTLQPPSGQVGEVGVALKAVEKAKSIMTSVTFVKMTAGNWADLFMAVDKSREKGDTLLD